MRKLNKLRHIAVNVIGVAGIIIGVTGALYSLDHFIIPSIASHLSSTSTSSARATPVPDIHFPPLIPGSPSPYFPTPDLTPTPAANENYAGQVPPSSIDSRLTPVPTAQNGKPTNNSIDDAVSTPTPNPASDEYGKPVTSSVGTAKILSLMPARGVQAGFLSKEVVSYSAQGFGGMKASLAQPSSVLNYFYLIIKDSNGSLVKSSPYNHGAKYTLMQTSHDDTAFFTWDNNMLPQGKYTAIIAKGPQVIFSDSRLEVLSERQFEVKPYDFSANNTQITLSDGYSIYAAKDLLTVLAPANKRFGIGSIDVKIYDGGGKIIWKECTLITDRYQLDFKSSRVPLGDYRAEAVITYKVWDNPHHRDVEKKVLLAAQSSRK